MNTQPKYSEDGEEDSVDTLENIWVAFVIICALKRFGVLICAMKAEYSAIFHKHR
jgi:hypothetical protein